MTRMLGRLRPSWCPVCRTEPGPDCPDSGCDTRAAKRRENRETRKSIEEERNA